MAYNYQQDCNAHNKVWYDGISLALSGTAKHKCRAPLKFKWRLEQRYKHHNYNSVNSIFLQSTLC